MNFDEFRRSFYPLKISKNNVKNKKRTIFLWFHTKILGQISKGIWIFTNISCEKLEDHDFRYLVYLLEIQKRIEKYVFCLKKYIFSKYFSEIIRFFGPNGRDLAKQLEIWPNGWRSGQTGRDPARKTPPKWSKRWRSVDPANLIKELRTQSVDSWGPAPHFQTP